MVTILFSDEQLKLKLAMESAYKELLVARDTFIDSLKNDSHLAAWSPSVRINPGANPRAEAIAIYGDFFFPNNTSRADRSVKDEDEENDIHPNVVSKGCGVVGASPETIINAECFNSAKLNFDERLKPMRGALIDIEIGPGKKREMALDRAALKACRIPLLSERQACRKVLVTKRCPAKVIFLWVSVPSTKKMSVAEVRARLRDMTVTPDVKHDLSLLDVLDEDEPLVYVHHLNPHLRVKIGNYETKKKEEEGRKERTVGRKSAMEGALMTYVQKTTSMPILVPMEPEQALPEISGPRGYLDRDETPVKKKEPQKKRKLEQSSYLRAINVFRYQEIFRCEIINSDDWRKKVNAKRTVTDGKLPGDFI